MLSFNLACVDKFERNLTLPGSTEPVQDKDVLLPQIIKKIFSHFCENVLSPGKDIRRRRAVFRVGLPAGGWDLATFTQNLCQRMINRELGRPY